MATKGDERGMDERKQRCLDEEFQSSYYGLVISVQFIILYELRKMTGNTQRESRLLCCDYDKDTHTWFARWI